ncbi:hypothetical protein L914_02202 [Phytophthora nicotianae]|uniref:Uncharacterized protein n=1 Tax=Phytophthora nicotianae TaxID=4792 RepID=W2P3F7_PHYNI|nr:hypothetical protein L916_02178 [Phytophthora nicotianae]ETM54469.1 hypothetical protein L914_02202 [Phytophthora nicotianae]
MSDTSLLLSCVGAGPIEILSGAHKVGIQWEFLLRYGPRATKKLIEEVRLAIADPTAGTLNKTFLSLQLIIKRS